MSSVLGVRGLSKSYGELQALRGVSFQAQRGEVVAVVGPNGAGKTTLLAIIAGAQRASAGTVDRATSTGEEDGVGWAPQRPALYSRLSVRENLRLFARLEHIAEPERAVEQMLAQSGLGERASERVENLSGGNRQRVNVAIALISDPAVVVLDEPSSSLDPAQRERLWGFISGLAGAGTCVLFSSHNVAEAQRYADRVLVLDRGDLLFDGSPAELLQQAGVGAQADFEHALVAFLARRESG